jgi:putative endonuclease
MDRRDAADAPESPGPAGSHEFGRRGERLAAAFLQARGYRIVAANQRVGRGEIDLVVRRLGVLAFVEVKARRSGSCGAPEEAVTVRKQRQIARLAELWLAARPRLLAEVTEIRFDIVAVDATRRPPRVRHLVDAFDAS